MTQTSQAQIESEAFPVVGIQSPTAASLGKFGDIPVSLYTGMPQISIPLYTLNACTHGLPISLSYHASGLKVEEIGGWVGQNWALNAGGVITRTLRGLPDETGGGYLARRDSLVSFLNKYPLLVGDLPRDPMLMEDWNYMNNIETRAWDSEPDAFFFNVAGMTGKFVFNEDPQAEEQIVLIARQPVKIEPDTSGSLLSWTLWGPDGTRYIFGQREITTHDVDGGALEDYTSSWYLTEVHPPSGADPILLGYKESANNVYRQPLPSQSVRERIGGGSPPPVECPPDQEFYSVASFSYRPQYLLYIESDKERVEFFSSATREDVDYEEKLDSILVKSNDGDVLKRFDFTYDYYRYTTEARRLLLTAVQEVGSGESIPPFTFGYDLSPTAPTYDSKAIDHWGFYNGFNNSTLIPTVTYGGYTYPGANREPSLAHSRAGMLTQITYPTQGHTKFFYELNDYGFTRNQEVTPETSRPAGGIRISRTESYSDPGETNLPVIRRYVYEMPDGRSSGVLGADPVYIQTRDERQICERQAGGQPTGAFIGCPYVHRSSSSLLPLGSTAGGHVGYREVHVYTEMGTTLNREVHRFHSPYEFWTSDPDWPQVPPADIQWGHGQEIESIFYNAAGDKVQHVAYTYQTLMSEYPEVRGMRVNREGEVHVGSVFCLPNYYPNDYVIQPGWKRLALTTTTLYDVNENDSLKITQAYFYDTTNLQVKRLVETSPDDQRRVTEYEHAYRQYAAMQAGNMLTQLYRTTIKDSTSAPGEIVRQQRVLWNNTWSSATDLWAPSEEQYWDGGAWRKTAEYVDYDQHGRVLAQKDALNRTTTFTYGAIDSLFLSEASKGNLTRSYTYYDTGHKWGLLETIIDLNSHAVAFDYDTLRRLTEVTSPLGSKTTTEYHQESFPQYIKTTTDLDSTRQVVSLNYFDGLGRAIQTQLDEGDGNHIVSATEYDDKGRPWRMWKPYRTDAGGAHQGISAVQSEAEEEYDTPDCDATPYQETLYLPDPLGRIDQSIPPHCNNDPSIITNQYGVEGNYTSGLTIDEDGNETKTYSDGFGNQVGIEAGVGEPEMAVTEMDYDILGNLLEVRPPNYFDPPTGIPDNWKTTYTYNLRSLLISKTTPDADDTFEYKYDNQGNLRFVEDPNYVNRDGSGFLYTEYDDFDRIIETGVYGGATSFTMADPNVTNWPSSDVAEVVSYTYDTSTPSNPDSLAGFIISNPNGRLTQVDFDGGYYQYSYDDEGRVEAMHVYLDGLGDKLMAYAYDRQGNVTKASYQADSADALYHWYTYDGAGRLEAVKTNVLDDTTTAVREAHYSYTPTGQVEQLLLGGDQVAVPPINYEYHIRDWLTKINDPMNLGGNQFAMELGYDSLLFAGGTGYKNGNVSSMAWRTRGNVGPTTADTLLGYAFTYDALNRLTAAATQSYPGSWQPVSSYEVPAVQYDPNGNITTLQRLDAAGSGNAITYTYETGRNRLQSVGGGVSASFAYDANGNMTQGRSIDAMDYDRRNLPVLMEVGVDSLRFRYDADGQRIYKQLLNANGSVETFYVRGAGGSVVAVYTKTSEGVRWYWNILSGGTAIGRVEPPGPASSP